MTLSTDIYVLDEMDPMVIFEKCRELVGATDENPFEDKEGYGEDGGRIIHNLPGQGLPAWLTVYYRPDAPYVTDEIAAKQRAANHETYCVKYDECDCSDGTYIVNYLTINFDTAYGYSDELGRGCAHLHASYILTIGRWLDLLGIKWKWENEFTGEVHEGYDALEEFVGGGIDARNWFQDTVKPAILAEHPQAEFF